MRPSDHTCNTIPLYLVDETLSNVQKCTQYYATIMQHQGRRSVVSEGFAQGHYRENKRPSEGHGRPTLRILGQAF